MPTRNLVVKLPPLPDDALELIWEYVRVALRPRMKRHGPLLRDIRISAAGRMAAVHTVTVGMLYSMAFEDGERRVPLECFIVSLWKALGLYALSRWNPAATLWSCHGTGPNSMRSLSVSEGDPPIGIPYHGVFTAFHRRAETLVRRVESVFRNLPAMDILRCDNPSCRASHLMYIGKSPDYVMLKVLAEEAAHFYSVCGRLPPDRT